MRTVIVVIFIMCGGFCYSQKDTIINNVKYRYMVKYCNGKIKKVGEYKDKKQEGNWIYYNRKGEEVANGKYNKNGKKEGRWYYYKMEFHLYQNGKVVYSICLENLRLTLSD